MLSQTSASLPAVSSDLVASRPSSKDASGALLDMHTLFAQLSSEVTALSLALAPPSESWDAVTATCGKLQTTCGKTLYCLGVLRQPPAASSSAKRPAEPLLGQQYRNAVTSVFDALESMISECLMSYTDARLVQNKGKIRPQDRQQILNCTSVVWKMVEWTTKFPRTEEEAFERAWKDVLETAEDSMDEVDTLLARGSVDDRGEVRHRTLGTFDDEEAEDEDSAGEEGGAHQGEYYDDVDRAHSLAGQLEDDLWGDDGNDSSPINKVEYETIQAAHALLMLGQSLMKRVPAVIAARPGLPLAALNSIAQDLLAAQDELVCQLTPEIDPAEVELMAESYAEKAQELVSLLLGGRSGVDDLADGLSGLSVLGAKIGAPASEPDSDEIKWLADFAGQLERAATAVKDKCAA